MNKKIEIDKKEIKNKMTLLLSILQQTMSTTGIAIGFDLEKEKLVLRDVATGLVSRVDLEKLNSIFVVGDEIAKE